MPCVSERRALQCFIQLTESLRLSLSPSTPIGLEQAIRSGQWSLAEDEQATGQQDRGQADERIIRLTGDPELGHQDLTRNDHQPAPELLIRHKPLDDSYKRFPFCHVSVIASYLRLVFSSYGYLVSDNQDDNAEHGRCQAHQPAFGAKGSTGHHLWSSHHRAHEGGFRSA